MNEIRHKEKMKSFCLVRFLAERHSPVLLLLSSSSSLFSLFRLMQLICRSCVGIRDELREPACKGLLPSSGEPGERPVRATWAKEKQQMSNYPCSAAHGGSDPVGKSVFVFPKFHILFTGRSDTEKVCHRVFWGVILLECTIIQSDVTHPHCNSQQNEMSQRQRQQEMIA